MNCKQCQARLLDALAARSNGLEQHVALHLSVCSVCAEFHTVQQDLFRSIDAALLSLANPPVPPSLLPSLRARLQATRSPWNMPFWIPAAAGLLLAVSMAVFFLQNRATEPGSQLVRSTPSRPRPAPAPIVTAASNEPSMPRTGGHAPLRLPQPLRSTRPAPREVLTDPNEAQALASFATAVQQRPAWGEGFMHPAERASGDMTDIPALEIARVEVARLDGESW